LIDDLKDISDLLEKVQEKIEKYDSDGVISFHHIDQKDKYQELYEFGISRKIRNSGDKL